MLSDAIIDATEMNKHKKPDETTNNQIIPTEISHNPTDSITKLNSPLPEKEVDLRKEHSPVVVAEENILQLPQTLIQPDPI